MPNKYAFVMLIKEKWWKEFCRRHHLGKKLHSYVRTGVAPPKEASLILFYVTKPLGKMMGYAEFVERKVGDVDQMWKNYGHESALSSKERFMEFIDDQKASFIRFENLHEATKPIPLDDILMVLGVRRLSRKGFYISKETSNQLVSLMQ